MFATLKKLWNERGFEILLGFSIAFLIIFALYHKFTGTKGTYSPEQSFRLVPTKQPSAYKPRRRPPPRESKGEGECRRVLQYLFRKPFPSQRPDFLRNPVTGGNFNLELDCYNSELKLAVEYNGVQHYRYVPYFHRNKDHFLNQKYRDDMKRRICRQHGITLIEVPHTVKLEEIKSYLTKACRQKGYKI